MRQHVRYARFLVAMNATMPKIRPIAPTTTPMMPIVFALSAASWALDAAAAASVPAVVAAVTAVVVRSDSSWMRDARSAFVGACTAGNVEPDRSFTDENVFGPDVNDSSIFVPS